MRIQRTLRTIHKWAGLFSLAWLSVLAATGVILDHHEWRWVNQVTTPTAITSDRVKRIVLPGIMRHVAVDPMDSNHWIGGSERGLWRTRDNGQNWVSLSYEGADGFPQTLGLTTDQVVGWSRLWLATDDGIWTLNPQKDSAEFYGLEGRYVSSLGPGSSASELVGVVDKTEIFRIDTTDPNNVFWHDTKDSQVLSLYPSVSFFRFVFDVHVGRGLLPQPYGMWVNDFGGIAMVVLGLTGLLFWGLPRYLRGKKSKYGIKVRQAAFRWIFRFHGPVIGVLCFVPLLYFGVTGIFLNHIFGFIPWGQNIALERESLPPAYQYTSLKHEIESVVALPDRPDELIISTRLGLLESKDGGQRWDYDPTIVEAMKSARADAPAVHLYRAEDVIFTMSPDNFYRRIGDKTWKRLEGPTRAISSIVEINNQWYLKTSRGIWTGSLDGEFTLTDFKMPDLDGTPFFLFMADIHAGAIIHEQWKWVNDLVSLGAILLALSGVVVWWRRKWM